MLGRIDVRSRHRRHNDRLTTILRTEDRTAEIPRQSRPQDGTGIVPRQACQTVGSGPVLGRVEFFATIAAISGLKRINQCSTDAERRDQTKAGEHLAG